MSLPSPYLELILGPMFSGKTTRLIEHYKAYTFIGKKIVVLNYSLDVRYSSVALSSHDRVEIPCVFSRTLDKALWQDADVILINEGQFFADIKCVIDLVEKEHKRVYICGLDGDFQKNKRGSLLDLIPYCDNVCKLKSLCSECRNGKAGLFSYRITNETNQVVIGVENYKPLCRSCYEKMSSRKRNVADM